MLSSEDRQQLEAVLQGLETMVATVKFVAQPAGDLFLCQGCNMILPMVRYWAHCTDFHKMEFIDALMLDQDPSGYVAGRGSSPETSP